MRYIDADELLNRLPNNLTYKASVKRVLMQAPTADVVEVVRCKDCKHIETTEYGGYCCLKNIGVAYNDFCSYGERSENAIT